MNELTKVQPEEFGLDKKQANEIEKAFIPKILERNELEKKYSEIILKEISPELGVEASSLRKKLVKVRTGIADIHKTQKAFFLAAGRFVDAWKNKETLPVTQMEEKLSSIENYYVNLEKERLRKLQEERIAQIKNYVDEDFDRDLSGMEEDVWQAYFSARKKEYEDRIEAERLAEEERVRKEQENELERKRLEEENRKLRQEAEEKELKARQEEEKRLKIENDLKQKEEQERLKEIEEKRIIEESIQAELNKGDGQKIIDLINDLSLLKNKYEFKANKNIEIYNNVNILLDKIINYINSKA